MTYQDFGLIGGGAAISAVLVAIFKYATDRQVAATALRASEDQRLKAGDASVQVAAITSFTQLVATYQKDIAEMRSEIEGMRTRHAARELELDRKITRLSEQNTRLIRYYERAVVIIDMQYAQLLKTNPDWPAPIIPREIDQLNS